jgi:putative transposase
MTYNPAIHHRKSIRLQGYDYSSPGYYFLTVCTQNRTYLFGNIIDGKNLLNDAGKMIEKWYFEIRNKFSNIRCDEFAIMPNHFHCIIQILFAPVRMALRGHPDSESITALRGHPNSAISLPNPDIIRNTGTPTQGCPYENHNGRLIPNPKMNRHQYLNLWIGLKR